MPETTTRCRISSDIQWSTDRNRSAHGFLTLQDDTEIGYKCTGYYAPAADGAIRRSSCGVDWPLSADPILSAKDAAPPLAAFEPPFAPAAG